MALVAFRPSLRRSPWSAWQRFLWWRVTPTQIVLGASRRSDLHFLLLRLLLPLFSDQRRCLRGADSLCGRLVSYLSFLAFDRSLLHSRFWLPLLLLLGFLGGLFAVLLLFFGGLLLQSLSFWTSFRLSVKGSYPRCRGQRPEDALLLYHVADLASCHAQGTDDPPLTGCRQLVPLQQEMQPWESTAAGARVANEIPATTTQHELKPKHYRETTSATSLHPGRRYIYIQR